MINWIVKRLKYKSSFKDKITFFAILIYELSLFPFLALFEEIKKNLSYRNISQSRTAQRSQITSEEVLICIHEWAGYESKRTKKIGNAINEFECGLAYQLSRFSSYKGKYKLHVTLTISEREKYNYQLPENINLIDVSNKGYDFAGYAEYYRRNIENSTNNRYVILTNTSVEKTIQPFLDDFIKIFKKDESIGLLGISYNTKIFQTIIRNNFNPHIESFFIMTTSDILKQVVKKNRDRFPGDGITHKLLLIRKGEVKLSSIVLELGYKLAVILDDGNLYTFGKRNKFDNGYATWRLPHGDYRAHCKIPNKITPVNQTIFS